MANGPLGHRRRFTDRAISEVLEPRRMLAADLVISEFLASDSSSIQDSLGNREDWIEIHNRGDAPANLNSYFLTDDSANPEKWRFPVQQLAAGGYLVVFATDANQAVAGQELHTGFKISASGGYLGLIRASDDLPQFDYVNYPVQSTDVSYGLTNADNPVSAKTFFSVPSPGAANAPSATTPSFTVAGKTFNGSMTVQFVTPTDGSTIWYTIDRTTPTNASPSLQYTPGTNITVSVTTQIRARAFAPSLVSSPVTSQTYIAVDATVNTFRSNLPIVVLESYGAGTTMNDQTYINASAEFINTGVDNYADMLDAANFNGKIGLRYRGSTSFSYPKKQFAIETRDENSLDKSVSLLGMPSESDWVLYAPYTEKSLINNALAMDWARDMGHYASRVKFVEVYFNANSDTSINSADYLGVYILMEKPKLDSNRVDVNPVLPSATTEPDITGGYFFKKDRKETQEIAIDTIGGTEVPTQRFVMVKPDETELTAAQNTYLTGYLNDLDAVMNGRAVGGVIYDFKDPVNGYAKYIDVDSWVDYWIEAEFTRSVDAFWLSTFLYKPQGGKISMGPAWDFNLAFGQANYRDGASISGYNHDTLSTLAGFGYQYGFYDRLFDDPAFKVKVADRWQELRKTVFSQTSMMADIDAYVGLLSDNNGNYPVENITVTGGVTTFGVPLQTPNNPVVRNFQKWNVLGTYAATNSFYDSQGRWIEDVNLMKSWLNERAEWFDTQFIPPPVLSPVGGNFVSPTNVTMTGKLASTSVDTALISSAAGKTASVKAIVPSGSITNWYTRTFDASAWPISSTLNGSNGLGYDTTTTPQNYNGSIATNVQTAMQNVRTSIYMRVTFNIADAAALAAVDHLILKIKYDDGFVAWVNGARVIEANFAENSNPTSTSTAVAERDDTVALQFVEWDISEIKSQLVVGANVLAIQGLNKTLSGDDFLAVPALFSRTYSNSNGGQVYYTTDGSDPMLPNGSPSPTATLYSSAVAINSTKRVRARTLTGGAGGLWSGIADEVYNFDANALRITEIMYNPPAGAGYTPQEFEFIEVKNTGATSMSLNNLLFTSGVTFTFPNVNLAAGAYGVIVKNQAAFESRYGLGKNILGNYGTSNLSNTGETVSIETTLGVSVHSFTYSSTWYPTTNGGGFSLVAVSATQPAATFDLATGWRASYVTNGQPGQSDADTTAPKVLSGVFDPAAKTVQLTFTENVTVASPLSNVGVLNLVNSATVTPSGFSTTANTITFSISSLASGIFRLTLAAAAVTDSSGNPMAAAGTFSWLYVANAVTLTLPQSNLTWTINQLSVGTGGARLDLRNNALVVRNGTIGTPTAGVYSGITGLVSSGKSGGAGIGTSTTSAVGVAGVGVAIASEALNLQSGATQLWRSQTVDATSVLLKYTYRGDANLDGVVNADDYAWIDLYSLTPNAYSYLHGDFNLTGSITADDYALIDINSIANGGPL